MSSPAEQIKARLGIVDVAQSYVRLQKAGANYKANCPFHQEKTPSFFVSPSREIWHCFGCNRGGDIFGFVMEMEGVDFPEALKILGDRAGVEIRPVNPRLKTERDRVLQILEAAKNFYRENLGKNKEVQEYLQKRGLKKETIEEFGIGFAPNGWRNLSDFLKNNGYGAPEIERAGLAIKSNKTQENYYDRFRSRVMFPLNNSWGQIVGFSGRIFGEETENTGGKYINTPQTIVYDKSRILYGFDKAKEEIRKKDLCVLAEGQMDVIMSHQAGVKNAVAVSGTALTQEHLKMVKRLTENIAMAFDKDAAGFEAAKRAVSMSLKDGFDVRAIIIPLGKDPADAIRENEAIWKNAVADSRHIVDFYIGVLAENFKDKRLFQKKAREIVLPYVGILDNEMDKAHWVREIAQKLDIKEEAVWQELAKTGASGAFADADQFPETKEFNSPNKTRLELLKERAAGFALWMRKSEDWNLKEEAEEAIAKYQLEKETGEREKLALAAELFYGGMNDLKTEFKKLFLELERETIKFRLGEMADKIRNLERSGDEQETGEHLAKFYELTKKLNGLK